MCEVGRVPTFLILKLPTRNQWRPGRAASVPGESPEQGEGPGAEERPELVPPALSGKEGKAATGHLLRSPYSGARDSGGQSSRSLWKAVFLFFVLL